MAVGPGEEREKEGRFLLHQATLSTDLVLCAKQDTKRNVYLNLKSRANLMNLKIFKPN